MRFTQRLTPFVRVGDPNQTKTNILGHIANDSTATSHNKGPLNRTPGVKGLTTNFIKNKDI